MALAEKYRQFAELMAPPVEEVAVEEQVVTEEAAAAAAAAEAAAAAAAAAAALNESTESGEVDEDAAAAAEAEANADPPGKTLADIEADIRRFAALAEAVEACGENFVSFRMLGVSCYGIKVGWCNFNPVLKAPGSSA